MRYLFGFVGALALSLALMAGCSDENGGGGSGGTGAVGGGGSAGSAGSGGTAGTAGTGGMAGTGGIGGMAGEGGSGGIAGCIDNLCPCSEAGIRAAIAEGGGPFRFSCDGPTTVVPNSAFSISKDVILDGENNLTVQPATRINAFIIHTVNAELHGFSITGGFRGILSGGILTVANSTVSGNSIGIASTSLTLINSTVSGNDVGMGVVDRLQVINSTVSANNGEVCYSDPYLGDGCSGGGILFGSGEATVTNSTVSDNGGDTYASVYAGYPGAGMANMTLTNTLVDGDCSVVGDESSITSGGHNIESPGNTCGFDLAKDDRFEVTAEQLNLGPLQDNGGPTMTHALLPGSVAIDRIPEAECLGADDQPLTTDQRGEPRPETGGTMCDVGAFEVQP